MLCPGREFDPPLPIVPCSGCLLLPGVAVIPGRVPVEAGRLFVEPLFPGRVFGRCELLLWLEFPRFEFVL